MWADHSCCRATAISPAVGRCTRAPGPTVIRVRSRWPASIRCGFLVARGDDRDDLNVFASRRGNWEVMLRAAFYSKTLRNLLTPGAPVANTLQGPSGVVAPINGCRPRLPWKPGWKPRCSGMAA